MVQAHQQGAPSAATGGLTRKAVNIIAMGSSRSDWFSTQMVEQRPALLTDAQTWCINYMGAAIYCDRVIHIDPVHNYLNTAIVRELCERTQKLGIPFYTSHPHPLYKNHAIYPLDEVMQKLGVCYFNTSVSYAIALAMVEGYTEIGLFGCDFSYPDVHLAESGRACCEFWLGVASQRGVRVSIAGSSTILDTHCGQHPYGWFKDPYAPPVNGGALMTPPDIMAHIQKTRSGAYAPRSLMELQIGRPMIQQPYGVPDGTFIVGTPTQEQAQAVGAGLAGILAPQPQYTQNDLHAAVAHPLEVPTEDAAKIAKKRAKPNGAAIAQS